MASIFGHGVAALAICSGVHDKKFRRKLVFLGILSSIMPDADVIGFFYGIDYDSFWGHRGFTHSFLFAAIWAVLLSFIFFHKRSRKELGLAILILFICTASHGILDGLTSGGRGVALLSPWDNYRYFLPWRPILVSPLGASHFFSTWGLRVIISEAIWIGIPALTWIAIMRLMRKV